MKMLQKVAPISISDKKNSESFLEIKRWKVREN